MFNVNGLFQLRWDLSPVNKLNRKVPFILVYLQTTLHWTLSAIADEMHCKKCSAGCFIDDLLYNQKIAAASVK